MWIVIEQNYYNRNGRFLCNFLPDNAEVLEHLVLNTVVFGQMVFLIYFDHNFQLRAHY